MLAKCAARPDGHPIALGQRRAIEDNLLLRCLVASDRELLAPHFEPFRTNEGEVLISQGARIAFLVFPQDGVVSLSDRCADGSGVQVALLGREGMINAQLLLGCSHAPYEAVAELGEVNALRLDADILRALVARSPAALALFLRFVHAHSVHMTRMLAANRRDVVERLARWLLMCHDRIDGDRLNLVHRHLARMLGVRRATVTDAVHMLESFGALRSTRGLIQVRNRALLESAAGSSYRLTDETYRQTIAPFGR